MSVVKFLAIFVLIGNVFCQDDLEFSGYLKTLPTTSRFSSAPSLFGFSGDDYYGLISAQLRFNLRYYASPEFTVNAELKNQVNHGDLFKWQQLLNALSPPSGDYLDLDWDIYSDQETLLKTRIDRLWGQYSNGNLLLTVGRQRIAWGTALAWNPTDLFNPVSPLDFDNEEKNGADAVRAQYYLGATSKIDLAYKASDDEMQRVYAALIGFNYFDYDLNLILASYRQKLLMGFSWAGDIEGAGFRGEFVYSDGFNSYLTSFSGPKIISGDFVSAVISLDYTFESSLYLQSEVLYNGYRIGLSGDKWSLLFGSAYQFTPLLNGNLTFIYNPLDFSHAFLPSLSYSLVTNLDLSLVALISSGDLFDEYPGSDSWYLRLKWSF
ncbi:MAG: hypothetical protein KDD94_01635 [Calditrichaeota bacterium]|nr:hypothetical protein [Calditrichota bacterium]